MQKMSEEKKNKLRVSYTMLSLWDRGDVNGVVDTYFHVGRKTNEAMEVGKRVHKELEEHINRFNAFPEWFFKYELMMPETEKKMVVSYNELFDLSGVFDCVDTPRKTLFEFKTGNADSLEWARTWQIPLYFLIADLAKIEIEKAMLIRHNKESDFVIVHNSLRLREKARNVVDSLAPEIWEYFKGQGLI